MSMIEESWLPFDLADQFDVSDTSYSSGREIRENALHTTRDGITMRVCDMSDSHLYNAYMSFADKKLLREMVIRLFEKKISEASHNNNSE